MFSRKDGNQAERGGDEADAKGGEKMSASEDNSQRCSQQDQDDAADAERQAGLNFNFNFNMELTAFLLKSLNKF